MSEHKEQVKVFNWARKWINPPLIGMGEDPRDYYSELKWMHSSQNGLLTHPQHATEAIRAGLKKGIPDIFLPLPIFKHSLAGLYIEMKWGKNKQQLEQTEFEEWCSEYGYLYDVCYKAEEAIFTIEHYILNYRRNK